jgi:hypothetical protein
MALSVKRERKKRNDGGEDYPGHPKSAHLDETHEVTQNLRQLRIFTFSAGAEGLQKPE